MEKNSIPPVVNLHFEFETPEFVDRVVETFADEIIWEAPARGIVFTDHDQIVAHYRKIIAGIIDPEVELLHQFAKGEEVFDDRLVHFTAGENNVWEVEAGKRVKLRLAHYFKIKENKICHEIGYEMWHVID